MVYIIMSNLTCYAWFRTIKPRVKIWCFVFQHVFQYPLPPLCIVSRAEYQSVTTGLVLGWSSRKYHPEAMAFKAAQMESRGQYFKPGRAIMNYWCYHPLLIGNTLKETVRGQSFVLRSQMMDWMPIEGWVCQLVLVKWKGVDWGGGSVKNINVRLFDADRFASDVNRPECQRLEVFHKWGWLHKKGGG